MKTLKLLFGILLLACLSLSCKKERSQFVEYAKTDTELKITETPLIIGHFDTDGTFKFDVSQSMLLENWNHNLQKLSKIEAGLTTLETFKLEGDYYIKAKGRSWASTVPLQLTEDLKVYGGGISCTSVVCAQSTTGCIPKGTICTACSSPSSDCSRTLSSVAIFDYRM